jgi:hypothetical protein
LVPLALRKTQKEGKKEGRDRKEGREGGDEGRKGGRNYERKEGREGGREEGKERREKPADNKHIARRLFLQDQKLPPPVLFPLLSTTRGSAVSWNGHQCCK